MLTDGYDHRKDEVLELAKECPKGTRIFVFGLSNDCDKDMCKKVAKAGRGTCSLVPDSTDPLNLKA